MSFWRPTKVTWGVFGGLVVLNVAAPFVALPIKRLVGTGYFDFLLFNVPVYQTLGLMGLAEQLGLNVTSGGEFLPDPNVFGWVLIAVSVVFSLFVHYLLASVVSWLVYRKNHAYPSSMPSTGRH